MAQKLLIQNGTVVNADSMITADVLIENGKIKEVKEKLTAPGDAVIIDAKGKYVVPGGIDPHTHFQFEFMNMVTVDDFYTGTRAALAGGTTTIIDFALPKKGASLIETYKKYRKMADGNVCCDYSLHGGVTWWSDTVKHEMKELCSNSGVNSFKAFMAYKDTLMINDSELYEMFETCKSIGAVALVHAENGHIIAENTKRLLAAGVTEPVGHPLSRLEDVEAEAVNRAAIIADQVKCPLYVVHVMSKQAAEVIDEKRKKGFCLFGETLAAGLGTDGSQYRSSCWRHAAGHVLSPPLRFDPSTKTALMDFLASNGLQLTGSDNCTFNAEQRMLGKTDFSKIPNGVNGVEDRMSVVWEKGVHAEKIDPKRFVDITSTTAAKIFNIFPRKGCIAAGSDADVVVIDPNKSRVISVKTHHQAADFNIFEGLKCHGVAEVVIFNGKIVVQNGEVNAERGAGKFVPNPVFPPFVYGKLQSKEPWRGEDKV